MSSKSLRTVGLAAVFCAALLVAPAASAAKCPPQQVFNGFLLPGETDVINVVLQARGNTTFHFLPTWVSWHPVGQTVTMRVAGSSMTGESALAIGITQAAPGLYPVQLRGSYMGQDGLAILQYKLQVTQYGCS